MIRLNKFLAENTGISRREADEAIQQRRVEVAIQQVATRAPTRGARQAVGSSEQEADGKKKLAVIGQQVSPEDKVFLDGKHIKSNLMSITVMVNKPVGYLSSRRSQGGDPTVYDLLSEKYRALKTAGRLDKDSSGLMILSSDGDLIQRLTHPRYEKAKIYEVELDKPLTVEHRKIIAGNGVNLDDGVSCFGLEELRIKNNDVSDNRKLRDSYIVHRDSCHWQVTMSEGRNRQIRRTFATLGYTVTKLHRTDLGDYHLGNLPPGKWKEIVVKCTT